LGQKRSSKGKVFFTTFLREKAGYVAIFLGVAYFLLLIRSDVIQERKLDGEKRSILKETEAEGRKQADLRDKMSKLKKNDYVQQLARDKLGYIERGESPYKVIIK